MWPLETWLKKQLELINNNNEEKTLLDENDYSSSTSDNAGTSLNGNIYNNRIVTLIIVQKQHKL